MANKGPIARKETAWTRLRKQRGYKIRDLAETMGVGVGTMSSWFVGRTLPSPKHCITLCGLFGISEEDGRKMFIDDYQPTKGKPELTNELELPFEIMDEKPKKDVTPEPYKTFNTANEIFDFFYDRVNIDAIFAIIEGYDECIKAGKDHITALQGGLHNMILDKMNSVSTGKLPIKIVVIEIQYIYELLMENGYTRCMILKDSDVKLIRSKNNYV